MSDTEYEDAHNITCDDFNITPNFTPKDYQQNWTERLCYVVEHDDFAEREKIFHKFYEHIWNLLFGPEANNETRTLAIEFLVVQRFDASYFEPYVYNEWIKTVKAELIKREMFDFWKDEFVKKELGMFWARNCPDYFDDIHDTEAEEFLKI